jgi:dTDP-4-amino-4,6-dideoxygalactose transaminase
VAATTYDDEAKAHALALYQEVGLSEAWRQTGIPKPTIASWARRAGLPHTDAAAKTQAATLAASARADQLRAELRLKLLEKATDLLDRMDAEHVEFKNSAKEIREVVYPIAPAAAVQNYATSAAILIDKYRLEVGEATTRSESRALTLSDDELDAAIREAEDALQRAAQPHDRGEAPAEQGV